MTHAREPIRIVDKGWRREIWIANGELYCGKILEIRKGNKCSLHYHEIPKGVFLFAFRADLGKASHSRNAPDSTVPEEFELQPGQCINVPTGLIHQMEAIEDSAIFEFSSEHLDSDSHRLVPGD
jgi:D-lyxose ketol-isomerase